MCVTLFVFLLRAKENDKKNVLQAANSPREINLQVCCNLRRIELLYGIISPGNTKAVSQRKHRLNFSATNEKLNRT